jgi:LytR cell envelope-related transcriptional attenuator
VEHSSPLPVPSPEQWRAAALVAAAIATVELFILILIAIAFSTKFFAGEVDRAASSALAQTPAAEQPAAESSAPASGGKSQATSTATKPILSRRETAVIVLNGNGIAGAASTTSEAVRARGYLISGSANAPRSDFTRSLIMFRPGFEREGERLGTDMKIKRVTPLDGVSKADLQGAHLALIIGG